MKRTIALLTLIILFYLSSTKTVIADTNTFVDTYGNSFTYEDTWEYESDNLGDGYTTYLFFNENKEYLQLAYRLTGANITKADIDSLCKESNGEYVYKNSSNHNGITWYVTEYKNAVISYYGSINNVLYRINIPKENNTNPNKLAQDIMNGLSNNNKSTNNSSDNSSNIRTNAIAAGLFAALKTVLFTSLVFAVYHYFKNKRIKNKQNKKPQNKETTEEPLLNQVIEEEKKIVSKISAYENEQNYNEEQVTNESVDAILLDEGNKQKNNKDIKIIENNNSNNKQNSSESVHEPNESSSETTIEKEIIKYNSQVNKTNPHLSTNDSSSIRFCRKCGTELNAGSLFCRKCGTKIEE